MVEELVGFVSGNIRRKMVVDVLEKNGAEPFEMIARLTRIPKISLEKVMDELQSRDLVKKEGDRFKLTDAGDQVANIARSIK